MHCAVTVNRGILYHRRVIRDTAITNRHVTTQIAWQFSIALGVSLKTMPFTFGFPENVSIIEIKAPKRGVSGNFHPELF